MAMQKTVLVAGANELMTISPDVETLLTAQGAFRVWETGIITLHNKGDTAAQVTVTEEPDTTTDGPFPPAELWNLVEGSNVLAYTSIATDSSLSFAMASITRRCIKIDIAWGGGGTPATRQLLASMTRKDR